MRTECNPEQLLFAPVDGRAVVASFDGGAITSDAGALLFGATDRAIDLVGRFAACFSDGRDRERIAHAVATLVAQRVFGIALGYEDLIDHDQIRHDPVLAVLAGKLAARRSGWAPLAGKSTLNRLEHAPSGGPGRYHKIGHDATAVERLFVDLFLEAHARAPKQIILDSTPRTIPSTGARRVASSMATTTRIAICRSTSSAAGISWPPSCAAPTSMRVRARPRRSRASWSRSGRAGRGFASYCGPTRASPARA
jgi:hypothetical protein